jgi:hypothetical protein
MPPVPLSRRDRCHPSRMAMARLFLRADYGACPCPLQRRGPPRERRLPNLCAVHIEDQLWRFRHRHPGAQ